VTATRKKKTNPSRAARKGWETRRAREAEAAREKKRRARARAKEKRRKAELAKRRSEAGKRGYRTRLAKERARAALAELHKAVKAGKSGRRIDRVRESWHREKHALEGVLDDYDRYMAILEELSDDEAPDWDIAYGSTESAA
jgi:hypothetical protein